MHMEWFTEEEASRTICPLMTFAADKNCCGAQCMAWRWRTEDTADRAGTCNYLQRRLEVREPPTRFSR